MLLLTLISFSACRPPGDDFTLVASPDADRSTENTNPVGDGGLENGTIQSDFAALTATHMVQMEASEAAQSATEEVTIRETALSQTMTALAPTNTPIPTITPRPTITRTSTATMTPTEANQIPLVGQSCTESGGGRQKLRINNNTGNPAVLLLNGEESYACDVPPGVQRIFVVSGTYEISALMCENQVYNFGSHIINPTWVISLECP